MPNRNIKIAVTILLGLTAPLWWFLDWWRVSDNNGRAWALLFVWAWAFVVFSKFQDDARAMEAKAYLASPAGQAAMQAVNDGRVVADLADSGYELDENGEMVALEVVALPTWESEPPGTKLLRLLNEGVPLETAQAEARGSGHPSEYNFAAPMLSKAAQTKPSHPCAQLWWPEIVAAGEKHNVDPLLILEFMGNESACDPAALSHAKAMGLLQLMPGTAREIAPGCRENASMVWDPAVNVSLGACYIRMMADTLTGSDLSTYDSVFWVAAAYNSGPGRAGCAMAGGWLDGLVCRGKTGVPTAGNLPAETVPYSNAIASAYTGR